MKENIKKIMASTNFSQHVKDIVSLFVRLYNFNINQIKQVNKNSKESTIDKELLKAMVIKIRMSFKAYFLLIKNGLRYDSLSILRNIFESVITLKYIFLKDKFEEKAIRFIEYSSITNQKWSNIYLKYNQNNANTNNIIKAKEKYKKEVAIFKNKYLNNSKNKKDLKSWANLSTEAMSHAVRMQYDYDIGYRMWSGFVHSDINSLSKYTEYSKEKFIVSEKKNFKVESDLSFIIVYFMYIITIFNNVFELDNDNEILTLFKKLKETMKKYGKIKSYNL